MRPGFGTRHPAVAGLLASENAAVSHRIEWLNGTLPLQVNAYTSIRRDLPGEVLTSVRCLVRVEDRIVLCETRDGDRHIVPGGRRIDGESFEQTAAREVHEETGWLLRPESVRTLGWLHLQNLNDAPLSSSLPYPDFLQLVMCGSATERDGGRDANWTDIEGHETSSWLVSADEARASTSNELLELVYLEIMLGGP
jgi:8-oxo-dGTP pyrophosphatase MutT (NUDIX family)